MEFISNSPRQLIELEAELGLSNGGERFRRAIGARRSGLSARSGGRASVRFVESSHSGHQKVAARVWRPADKSGWEARLRGRHPSGEGGGRRHTTSEGEKLNKQNKKA